MTAPTPADTAQIGAYIGAVAAARTRVLQFVLSQWAALPGYRDSDADRFTSTVVPVMLAGERQIASLTNAYLTHVTNTMAGTAAAGAVLDMASVTGEALRGVAPETVYMRPFVAMRTDLSKGKPFDTAVETGARRLRSVASTDLQLASTHAARATIAADHRVVGYRRVLTGAENCAMCVVASTQRYWRGDLLPIHPSCDCAVAALVGDVDPGQVINTAVLTGNPIPTGANRHGVKIYSGDDLLDVGDLLESVHQSIQGTFGVSDRGGRAPVDYRKVMTVHQHGEIGPVLSVAGHRFTGPADIT